MKDLILPNQTQHPVLCVDGMLLRRTAVSASGMFAFLSSGFSSRSSLTGARVFAFDRHAHVCTPAREKKRILEGASI